MNWKTIFNMAMAGFLAGIATHNGTFSEFLLVYIALFITYEALDRKHVNPKKEDDDPEGGVRTLEATGRDTPNKVPA